MAEVLNDNTEIKVTQRAARQIKRIMEDNSIPGEYGLRVGVRGGGCSGLTYTLGFDSSPKDGDKVISAENDVRLFIDGKSLFYLTGTELDFSDGLNGRGFVCDLYFRNLKA